VKPVEENRVWFHGGGEVHHLIYPPRGGNAGERLSRLTRYFPRGRGGEKKWDSYPTRYVAKGKRRSSRRRGGGNKMVLKDTSLENEERKQMSKYLPGGKYFTFSLHPIRTRKKRGSSSVR